jgi:hypothetical protein
VVSGLFSLSSLSLVSFLRHPLSFGAKIKLVVDFPPLYASRCGEIYRMVNEKNRDTNLKKLMKDNPDWDWDYWVAQIS